MDIAALSLVVAAIFVWGIISTRQAVISTPIFFVAVGLILAEGLRLVDLQPDPHATKVIAEVTLVWVLFADASRVRFSDLREDLRYYIRLLAIGLPLTTALGTATAVTILGLSPWLRCLWAPRWPRPTQLLARRSCRIGGFLIECGKHSMWRADSMMESPRLSSRSHLLQSPPSRSWPRRASAWLDRFGLGRTDGRGAGCIRWHAAAFYWSARFGFGRVRGPIRAGTRTSPWAHGIAGFAGVVMIIGGAFQALEGLSGIVNDKYLVAAPSHDLRV
jgi:hypothetical protein